VIIGDAAHTLDLAGQLEGRGVFAPAIRPPTVPDGTSRLRISVRADHERSDIEALLDALADMRLTRR
jgi:7-keto-8-aminopelargonate synthetase-like enzyme